MKKTIALISLFSGVITFISITTPDSHQTQIDLGHHLFFDKKLSINGTKSCASCHDPIFAFTDGYRKSQGAYADVLPHNAPSCLNLNTYQSLNWASPNITTLVQQNAKPLFAQNPIELGIDTLNTTILNQFQKNKKYCFLFKKAFPKQKNVFLWRNIQTALAAYTAQLTARNSKYDQWKQGDLTALSPDEKAGADLFFSEKLACAKCHNGKDLSIAENDTTNFYNIGLYQKYPETDDGLYHQGRFRTPSLRNIAITAPYMHDGSVEKLEDVIKIFEHGGQLLSYGNQKGNGALNPQKSIKIKPFSISEIERRQIISFLYTLTDTTYLQKPLFQDPN